MFTARTLSDTKYADVVVVVVIVAIVVVVVVVVFVVVVVLVTLTCIAILNQGVAISLEVAPVGRHTRDVLRRPLAARPLACL